MTSSKLRTQDDSWLSRLPTELVEDHILCKSSIKTLIRFKSTCKHWYALLKDKSFIYRHYDHFQEQVRFIRMYYDKVQIINPTTSHILSLPVPPEFCINKLRTDLNTVASMIHCDGLLLCHCRNGDPIDKLAVWNPVMNRITWIQPLHSYNMFDIWGFGYDKDGYKILRIYTKGYEIYDFKSKLWRFFPTSLDCYVSTRNVCMKGNMYWIARNTTGLENFILSFDFSKETFKSACSYTPIKYALEITVLSGFGGDKLSLLHQDSGDNTGEIEVWVTNKLSDEVVSWSKYFSVTRPADDLPRLHPISSNPAYFINKRNCIMLLGDKCVGDNDACPSFYEICEGEIIKQVTTGPPYRIYTHTNSLCSYVYVPSLVPVPE